MSVNIVLGSGHDEERSLSSSQNLFLAGGSGTAVFAALLSSFLEIREQVLADGRCFCCGLTPVFRVVRFLCHVLIVPAPTEDCVK